MRKWVNVELKRDVADKLRLYCKVKGVKFETSEADNLIHFELYLNDAEQKQAQCFLDRL